MNWIKRKWSWAKQNPLCWCNFAFTAAMPVWFTSIGPEGVAGVALGAVIVGVARGAAPTPPSAELCWYWTDSYQEQGYWDHCGGY